MKRAPVLITAYNRPDCIRSLLECITHCDHYEEYSFYIHIDGANIYKDDDEFHQKEIQNVINEFLDKMNIIEIKQETVHIGLANSIIMSVSEIINKNERIIVLEDDLLLSPDALDFMNDALDFYQDDDHIWSVTAWTPKLAGLKEYKNDVYFQYRGCSISWGTWKNRWNKVDWDVSDYDMLRYSYRKLISFCRGGYDLPGMLRSQMMGFIDSWAIRWVYAQIKNDSLTVYPAESRVINIGIGDIRATHSLTQIEQNEIQYKPQNYKFIKSYKLSLLREFKKYYRMGYKDFVHKYYRKQNDDIDRLEGIIYVMEKIRSISETGHSISEYFFSRGYKKIAVYGYGKIGRYIESELRNTGIELMYFIDRNKNICDGNKCLDLDSQFPEVDCTVISLTRDISNIRRVLRNNGVVKSIVEVLRDI